MQSAFEKWLWEQYPCGPADPMMPSKIEYKKLQAAFLAGQRHERRKRKPAKRGK